MPLYTYQCPDCGLRFERVQRYYDPAMTRCPTCHQGRVRRLIVGRVTVMYRGGGFYCTDKRAG